MAEQTMNGAAETLPLPITKTSALPMGALYSATEIILANGLKVWVYQESQSDYRRLFKTWLDANPNPDKKSFEVAVPAEDASFEGQTLSADSNPEYKDLLQARMQSLNDYLVRAYILGYTDFPDHTESDLIARYERVISRKRKVMDLPADAWEATLFHAILTTEDEKRQIVQAVEKKLAVDYEEVVDSVAIFRPVNSGRANRTVSNGASETQSPAAQSGIQPD